MGTGRRAAAALLLVAAISLAALPPAAAASCDCNEIEALHDKLSDAALALTRCRKDLLVAQEAASVAGQCVGGGDQSAEVRQAKGGLSARGLARAAMAVQLDRS